MRLEQFIVKLRKIAKDIGERDPVVSLKDLRTTIAIHIISPVDEDNSVQVKLIDLIPSETKVKDIELNEPEKVIMLDVFRSE